MRISPAEWDLNYHASVNTANLTTNMSEPKRSALLTAILLSRIDLRGSDLVQQAENADADGVDNAKGTLWKSGDNASVGGMITMGGGRIEIDVVGIPGEIARERPYLAKQIGDKVARRLGLHDS